MKKKLALGLLMVLFVGLSAGQTLQNFEYSPEDGFDKSLTGGESFVQEINFTSGVDRPVPLAVEVRVEAEEHGMSETGEEFDLSDSQVIIEDYSLYDYWEALTSSRDVTGEHHFKVIELDDPQEGVPEEIVLMKGACDSKDDDQVFSLENDDGSCDFESVSGVEATNLSVDNRVKYDRSEVEGDISQELLPDIDEGVDKSTVVPVIRKGMNETADITPSNYSLVPARFSLDAALSSYDQNYELLDGKGVYRLPLETLKVSDGADVSLRLVLESSPRIRPDTFSFEFDVRSVPGFASETKNRSVGEDGRAEVEVGKGSVRTSVDVSAEEGSNVSVESYDEVSVAPPKPESEFVGGVGVEVTKDDKQIEASGNVTVSYDQSVIDSRELDEDTMNVYFFNESRGEWTTEGVEVVNRDTEDNTVTAEASHFSVYAAFADREQQQEDDGVPTFTGPIEWSPPRGEEENVNDSAPQDQDDEQDTQQDDTQDDQGSAGEDDTGSEQGDSETTTGPQQGTNPGSSAGPTGLFTGRSSGVIGGLFVLVLALVGYLQYSGRIKLGEMVSGLRS